MASKYSQEIGQSCASIIGEETNELPCRVLICFEKKAMGLGNTALPADLGSVFVSAGSTQDSQKAARQASSSGS